MDRCWRWHKYELSLLTAGAHGTQSTGSTVCRRSIPVCPSAVDRPDHWQDGRSLRQVYGDENLPARHGGLLGERILGKGSVSVYHRSIWQDGSSRPSHGPLLFHFQPSARHGQCRGKRELPAVSESAGLGAGVARLVGCNGPVVHEGHRAPAERVSAFGRWDTRAPDAAE